MLCEVCQQKRIPSLSCAFPESSRGKSDAIATVRWRDLFLDPQKLIGSHTNANYQASKITADPDDPSTPTPTKEEKMKSNIERGAPIIGRLFSFLTVIREDFDTPCSNSGRRYWCRCKCGRVISVARSNLLSKHTRSCGCLRQSSYQTPAELGAHHAH
jgi:hypothetical protein